MPKIIALHTNSCSRSFTIHLLFAEDWKRFYSMVHSAPNNTCMICNEKKAIRETQTLRTGCSKAEPKIFAQPQTPFPGAQDDQNLISWRWSLPLPTNPVWWGSVHAILSYRGNRPTNTHTHKQMKKRSETQTLRAGCSNAEPKKFGPPQTPFSWAQDSQNLISWRWSLLTPADPVWWRSIHAISSYRGNRPTNTQTGPITMHCSAASQRTV